MTESIPTGNRRVAVRYSPQTRRDEGPAIDVALDLDMDTVWLFDETGQPVASLDREDFNAQYRIVDSTELSVGPYRDFQSKLKSGVYTAPALPAPALPEDEPKPEITTGIPEGVASLPSVPLEPASTPAEGEDAATDAAGPADATLEEPDPS